MKIKYEDKGSMRKTILQEPPLRYYTSFDG